MPRKLKPGDKINGYEILQEMNIGALAMSYAARSAEGEKVFFKLYKSPTVTVPWYRDYVSYQQELKRRIETTAARGFTYRFIDAFEDFVGAAPHPTYFQVFEFVEGGEDLEKVLETIRARPDAISWDQRLTMAKVMMAGVSALHDAGIVHGDLKPPNIQLFRDPSIAAGYRLKLIDMDYSVLADRRAPWHGHQGYVGSPNYFSPEHLIGPAPMPASDVFTCGLILYELLANRHPYDMEDPDHYREQALAGRPEYPRLVGEMPAPATNEDVANVIQHCLAPDPAARPSARDVNLILNGKMGAEPYVPPDSPRTSASVSLSVPDLPPVPGGSDTAAAGAGTGAAADSAAPTGAPAAAVASAAPAPAPSGAGTAAAPAAGTGVLELRSESGVAAKFRIRTAVGKHLCRQFGEDARFLDTVQFTLVPDGTGNWSIEPQPGTTNETLVNGKAITHRTLIAPGDVIAVGREAKGIAKLPLTVHLR